MSSIGVGGSAAPSEPRKKFGKNLNKLTKPPPPPPSNPSSRGQASSRNGLLVLSTKRSSSGGSASSNLLSKLSGGAAPRPLNTPSLRSEVGVGVDSLSVKLGDGSGGWGVPDPSAQPSQHQQQAWKVEEKAHVAPHSPSPYGQQQPSPLPQDPTTQPTLPVLAPKGGLSTGYGSYTRASSNASSTRWGDMDDADDGAPPNMNFGGGYQSGGGGNIANGPPVAGHHAGGSSPALGERQQHQPPSHHRFGAPPPGLTPPVDRDDFPRSHSTGGTYNSNPRSALESHATSMYGNGPDVDSAASPRLAKNDCQAARSVSLDRQLPYISSGKIGISQSLAAGEGGAGEDEQVQYMKRLARERAEARRKEEERRMAEQKDRAARRLRELEEKIATVQPRTTSPVVASPAAASVSTMGPLDVPSQSSAASVSNWRQQKSKKPSVPPVNGGAQNSEIVLERLGRAKNGSAAPSGGIATSSGGQYVAASSANARGRSDPSRTYSSLVGGSTASKKNSGQKEAYEPDDGGKLHQKHLSQQPQQNTAAGMLHTKQQTFSTNNNSNMHPGVRHGEDQPPPISFIQLSSYDDRDRGERGRGAAGPRMLFDPKSGSMIEAPAPDKRSLYHGDEDARGNGGGSSSKVRKERRSKKTGSGDRGDRERSDKVSSSKRSEPVVSLITKKRSDSDATLGSGENTSGRAARIREDLPNDVDPRSFRRQDSSGRKDELRQRRERKRPERKKRSESFEMDTGEKGKSFEKGFALNGRRIPSKGARRMTEQPKIPRTRGVLYKKDTNGNYVCADGCEADQGYGLHSVPGGRVRNPTAYAKFLQQQRSQQSEEGAERAGGKGSRRSPAKGDRTQQQQSETPLSKKAQKRLEMQQKKDRRQGVGGDFGRANGSKGGYFNQNAQSPAELSSSSSPDRYVLEDDGFYLPQVPNVTAKDSLTLLVDGPESPTLQATANEWRPSEAALAAAAAAAAVVKPTPVDVSSRGGSIDADHGVHDNDEEEDESINSMSFGGLGFDPTKQMDSVMMSPSLRSEAGDDEVEESMPSLNLDGGSDPLNNAFSTLGSPGRFLGSSTWGAGGSLNSSPGAPLSMGINWNLLGSESGEAKSSSQQPSTSGQQQTATSFLSLSPLPAKPDGGSTWGSGAFGGGLGSIGGTAIGGGRFNTEGTGGSGDG